MFSDSWPRPQGYGEIIPGPRIADRRPAAVGWTVGAGAEWMFAPHWSLKAEYLYVDLGSHSSTIIYTYGANSSTMTSAVRDTENIARAGINYHF